MKRIFTIICALITINLSANVSYIRFEQIPDFKDFETQKDFLIRNIEFYNHRESEWNYKTDKMI
jgi:hypothetical protein